MSSPVGLDAIGLAKDLRNLFIGLRQAPAEFQELENERRTLEFLTSLVIGQLEGFKRQTGKSITKEADEVFSGILRSCIKTAETLRNAEEKYKKLGPGKKWHENMHKRARWLVGTVRYLKDQLMRHETTLGIIHTALGQEIHSAQLLFATNCQRTEMLNALRILRDELRLDRGQHATQQQMKELGSPMADQVIHSLERAHADQEVMKSILLAFTEELKAKPPQYGDIYADPSNDFDADISDLSSPQSSAAKPRSAQVQPQEAISDTALVGATAVVGIGLLGARTIYRFWSGRD